MASLTLDSLRECCLRLATSYRLAHSHKAKHQFVEFTDTFASYIEQEQLMRDPFINNVLNIIIDAHQRKDFLYIADIVEYELCTYLTEQKNK